MGDRDPELESRTRLLALVAEVERHMAEVKRLVAEVVGCVEELDYGHPSEARCATCGDLVGLFLGHARWQHYEVAEYLLGPGARLVERDHEPEVRWGRPRIPYLLTYRWALEDDEGGARAVVSGVDARDAERRWREDEGGPDAQPAIEVLSVEPLGDAIVRAYDP